MSRLSRFLPKFLRGGDKSNNNVKSGDKSHCKIIFLDETEYFLPYKGGIKGQLILDKVFEQLNLFEKDFFGLRFIDQTGQAHWLDINKTLSAQLKVCSLPYTLYFGVKFYPADPCKLKEEITRYQFFLQVKRDILHGRLPVTFEEAAELFSYAVQSELGDFESQNLPPGYVSEFQFVPNQTEELEDHIAVIHRKLSGMVPATAELKFLDKVKWLDMYGVDLHPVLGESNTEYFLGLTPTGIVVYKNKTKVGNYFWPRVTKVTLKGKVFIIKVKDKINDEHTYAFELSTKAACKHLWKCCVEHHAFFRLNQLGEAASRTSKPYRSTAKHRSSGRGDRQNLDTHGREEPRVMRVQSRRQARRAMSDSRLNQGDMMTTGVQYSEGHITMVVNPEKSQGSRHRSLPDLKGRESPTSTRSAPWETNMDTGLYTSGRESPISVTQSENVNHYRRHHRDSDSEGGHRRNRMSRRGYDSDGGRGNKYAHRRGYDSDGNNRNKYFPSSRKGSDNESDVSFTRRRRREYGDSGSESDISPKYTARQRKAKSMGPDRFEQEWNDAVQNMYIPGQENRPNGSIPSIHSAPLGEARQKKMRRRRSKSPGSSKRPPEELRQHIEFDLIDPDQLTEDQIQEMRDIPYVNVETKAEPFKVKYSPKLRQRYRSPKRKSFGELELSNKGGYTSEEPPPTYFEALNSNPSQASKINSRPPQQQPVKDIRSYPQFHENLLFYEPNNSPRYHQHYNLNPMVHRYHPPPTAVFKPIDGSIGRGSSVEEGNNRGQDSNRDSGLNSSQGSSSVVNTPPRPAGRMYGTQDAIARLYSSPAGTRRRPDSGNQSYSPANRNSGFSGPNGYAVTNQNGQNNSGYAVTNQNGQNNRQTNQNGAFSSPSVSAQNGPPYVNASSVKPFQPQTSMNSYPRHQSPGYSRPQQSYNQSRNSDISQTGTSAQQSQNGYSNHPGYNSQLFYNQSDRKESNHVTSSHEHHTQHQNSMYSNSPSSRNPHYQQNRYENNYSAIPGSQNSMYNTQTGPQKMSQNSSMLENRTQNNSMLESRPQNSSMLDSRPQNNSQNQSAWQYVGNGDVRSNQSTAYNPSPYTQQGHRHSNSGYSSGPILI